MDKFVIVDDEKNIILALKRQLADWAEEQQLEIISFTDPQEALDYMSGLESVALLVTDFRMPGMTGAELIAQIRGFFFDMGCVLLSGYSDLDSIQNAIQSGINSYIHKPWENDELIDGLNNALLRYKMNKETNKINQDLMDELEWSKKSHKILTRYLPFKEHLHLVKKQVYFSEFLGSSQFYYQRIFENGHYLVWALGNQNLYGSKGLYLTCLMKMHLDRLIDQKKKYTTNYLMHQVNDVVVEADLNLPELSLGLSIFLYNTEEKVLSFTLADAEPFFVHRGSALETIHLKEPGVGFKNQIQYRSMKIGLKSQDSLYIYTRGFRKKNSHSELIEVSQVKKGLLKSIAHKEALSQWNNHIGKLREDKTYWDDYLLLKVDIL
ncbi:response regulator [Spirochaeta cellobiosiphila]|uniref:response regulator n=1 Tax=Spirochaeta cellobiosiphila TaxID=504483 RepID=UPI00041C0CA7|nr:response regulator [Spirochaeta cellobiosiphila]